MNVEAKTESKQGKENPDEKTGSQRDPFSVMDEAQKSDFSFADAANEVDNEEEDLLDENEKTGLAFIDQPKIDEKKREKQTKKKPSKKEKEKTFDIEELKGKEESELTDEEKAFLEKSSEESEEDDPEFDLAELQKKDEEDLTDEEKAFLEKNAEDSEEEEEKAEKEDHPEWMVNKLKEINPDLDTSDGEAVQKAFNELTGYKDLAEKTQKDLEAEQEANKEFYDLLGENQDLQEVTKFMYQHNVSLPTALAALDVNTGVDMEKLKKEDPDAYVELKNAKEARKKKAEEAKKKAKDRKKLVETNASKSEENANSFKKEKGIDSKTYDAITDAIQPSLDALADGLVTKELLQMAYDHHTIENRIKEAKEAGIKEGKNMKVDELVNERVGDRLPDIGGTRQSEQAEREKGDVWSEALSEEPRRISDIQ